jgi:hypothetical protein
MLEKVQRMHQPLTTNQEIHMIRPNLKGLINTEKRKKRRKHNQKRMRKHSQLLFQNQWRHLKFPLAKLRFSLLQGNQKFPNQLLLLLNLLHK